MTKQRKTFDCSLQIKAVDESTGGFEGYGAIFGNTDAGGDVIVPGAFAETLKEIAAKGRKVPILWQHDMRTPIGAYDEITEDENGLKVKGRLFLDVSQAKDAYALLKGGAVTGLSIGYAARKWEFDEEENVRILKEVDLWEVSLVTFPMNDEARISAVKERLEAGELPSLKEFENLLREAGFSKTQAVAVANHGLKHLLRSESAPDEAAVLDTLKGFKLPTIS